jgi:hypothetical protein
MVYFSVVRLYLDYFRRHDQCAMKFEFVYGAVPEHEVENNYHRDMYVKTSDLRTHVFTISSETEELKVEQRKL